MGQFVAAAGTLVEGIGGFMEGQARASALKEEARVAEVQGKQDQTARLNELQKTQGAITTLFAQRNIDAASPSAMAYQTGVQGDTYKAIDTVRGNAAAQAMALRRSASISLLGGTVAGASSLLKAGAQAFDTPGGSMGKAAG